MQQLSTKTGQPTPIIRARYEFLKNEIARWQEENILNRAQADEILSRYSIDGGKQHGLTVMLVTGACLLGAAILLLISTNWPGVSFEVKGFAVVAAMLACYVFAWKLKGRTQLNTIVAEALIFLCCILFGSGTNLVAQHFQITGSQPEILIWAMGIAPLVILFRSHSAAVLLAAVVAYRTINPAEPTNWFVPLALMSTLYCAYYMRNQWALAISLGAAAAVLCASHQTFDEFAILFYAIGLFILHLWHEHSKRWQVFATPYLLASFALVLSAICGMSNEYSSHRFLERTSIQRIQIEAVLTLLMLAALVCSPAARTRWPIAVGIGIVGAVLMSAICISEETRMVSIIGVFVVNLFYLFYFASTVENRILQFIPVVTLTTFSLIFLAAAPGGAMVGSGIAFGIGLVLMICSFAALARLMGTRTASERSLKKNTHTRKDENENNVQDVR